VITHGDQAATLFVVAAFITKGGSTSGARGLRSREGVISSTRSLRAVAFSTTAAAMPGSEVVLDKLRRSPMRGAADGKIGYL
jgi:hypothetical protein